MKIDISKVDKLQLIIMIVMFVAVIGGAYFNDVSLIFKMKFIYEEYWFVKHLELVVFCFFMIGLSLGYIISKMKYKQK